jgi:putative nucleotidyltransferase with HDIG domain
LFLFLELVLNHLSYPDITKFVGILIHMREPYDSHGARVASMAARMATEMGMTPTVIKMIGVGAHLHDVGKLLTRSYILNATRKLNDSERAEMQNHVRLGWNIVNQMGCAPTIQEIVLYHHEKWNGKGYPNGMMGDAIPVPVQVVTICDVYEAMTNARPYREAYSYDFTKSFMLSRGKIDFDDDLVKLFFDKVMPNG